MKAFLKKIKPIHVIIVLILLLLLILLVNSLGGKAEEGFTQQEILNKMKTNQDEKTALVAEMNEILTSVKSTINVPDFMVKFQTYFTLFYNYKRQDQTTSYLAVDVTSAGGNNDGKIFRRKTDYSVFRDNSGNIASDEDLLDVGLKDKNKDGWVIVNKDTNNYIRDASGGKVSEQVPALTSQERLAAYSVPNTVSAAQLLAARGRVTSIITSLNNVTQTKMLKIIDKLELNVVASIDIMSTQTDVDLKLFEDSIYNPFTYDGLLSTSSTGTRDPSGVTSVTSITPLDVGAGLVGSTWGGLTATAPPAWYTTPPSWWKSATPPSTTTTMPISNPTYGSLLGADYSLFPVSTTQGTSTSTSAAGTQGTSTQGTGTGTQGLSSTQGTGTGTQGFSSTQGLSSTQGTGTGQGTGTSTGTGIGITKANIPPGQEDLYILKTQAFPPGCPAGGCGTAGVSGANNFRPAPVPPCPPCERCPEPAFSCKKVPNYDSTAIQKYLPQPVLASFSQFGM
jgi:hypothetical protein